MSKRILAYAVIILSVVYFYSSEAIALSYEEMVRMMDERTPEQLRLMEENNRKTQSIINKWTEECGYVEDWNCRLEVTKRLTQGSVIQSTPLINYGNNLPAPSVHQYDKPIIDSVPLINYMSIPSNDSVPLTNQYIPAPSGLFYAPDTGSYTTSPDIHVAPHVDPHVLPHTVPHVAPHWEPHVLPHVLPHMHR